MSELKPRITENGIDYILVGDYYIPDLKLPEEHRPIGKYGRCLLYTSATAPLSFIGAAKAAAQVAAIKAAFAVVKGLVGNFYTGCLLYTSVKGTLHRLFSVKDG